MTDKNLILYTLIAMINNAESETNDTIIAKAFIENRTRLYEISLDQFAQEYFVSQASISRLIKKLGFTGYNEFREKFAISQYDMQKRHETPPCQYDQLKKETYDRLESALQEIRDYQESDFTDLIAKIRQYQTIYFIGSELSMAVLRLLQYKLIAQGKNVYNIQNVAYQNEMMEHCKEDALVIAISIDDRWLAQFPLELVQTCKAHTMLWTVKSDSPHHQCFQEVVYFGKYIGSNIGYHQLMQFEQILFRLL